MTPAAVRHERLRSNGIELHVALAGRPDAPLLLCLHGFPEFWYSWRHQLAALSDRFLVAAPDLRGYGESDKPPGGYEIPNLAADAAGLVRALGRERAIVCGHDWGGIVAYAMAALHPSTVERLAVLNCPHPGAVRTMFTSLDQLRRSWYIFAIQIPRLFDWRLAKNGAEIIPRMFMAAARRRKMFTPADLDAFRQAFARPGVVRASLEYYRSNFRFSTLFLGSRLPPIGAPTIVVTGRDDPAVGPDFFVRNERFFTGPYEIRHVPDCGHWTQQEAPELVNELLGGFAPARKPDWV